VADPTLYLRRRRHHTRIVAMLAARTLRAALRRANGGGKRLVDIVVKVTGTQGRRRGLHLRASHVFPHSREAISRSCAM